jgi:hypothetical protein
VTHLTLTSEERFAIIFYSWPVSRRVRYTMVADHKPWGEVKDVLRARGLLELFGHESVKLSALGWLAVDIIAADEA